MKIDISVPIHLPAREQIGFIRRAEELGFDGAGLPDHVEHGHDVFAVLAAAAGQTQRIDLYPCVTNPVTRHPWVLANVASTMQELAPGRFRLVVGAGDSAVLHTGGRPARVAELRDAVLAMRGLLQGEAVRFGERAEERISGIEGPQPPVVVAAGGPRMIEAAGEAADEVFLLTGFDRRILDFADERLRAGAARSGRSLEGFGVTHYTVCRIEDDPETAKQFGRSRLRGWLKQGFFRESLLRVGLEPAQLEDADAVPDEVLDGVAGSFFLIGPAESIAERLQEQAASGRLARTICVASSAAPAREALEEFGSKVLARIKG